MSSVADSDAVNASASAPDTVRDSGPGLLTLGRGFTLERIFILGTLTFVTILYAMAVTIVNVALPDIRGALSATQDQVTWVVTANIIATAVATPIAGWAAGRFGVRRVMLCGTILFTASSILCGMATSLESLVGFRILQGLSGAPLIPLSQAILLARFPKNLHNQAMAIWGMGTVLGPIIAPSVGGYLSEAYGWRWVFYLIVPFGLVAITGVWFSIRATGRRGKMPLDGFGFAMLAITVASLQLMLDRGQRLDWFQSPEIIIEAGVLVVAFYLFLTQIFTSEQPFVRPAMFKDRNYSMGVLMLFIFGLLNFVPMVLFPPLLQEIRGFPPSVIGLLLAMRGAGTLAGFTLLAFASRLDPRIPVAAGFALQAATGFIIAGFSINLTAFDVGWTSFLQGLGVGLIWVPINVIAFSTLKPESLPDATAILHLLRNMGSSIFISISVIFVLRTSKVNYAELGSTISPFNKTLDVPFLTGGWSFDTLSGIAQFAREMQRQSLMNGYLNSFLLFAVTATIAVPIVLLIRLPKVRA